MMGGTKDANLSRRSTNEETSPPAAITTDSRKSINIRLPAMQFSPEPEAAETLLQQDEDVDQSSRDDPVEPSAGTPTVLRLDDRRDDGQVRACSSPADDCTMAPPPSPAQVLRDSTSRLQRLSQRLMTPVLEEMVPSSQDASRLLYHAEEVAVMGRDELELRLMELQGFNIHQEATLGEAISLLTEEEESKALLQSEVEKLEVSLHQEKQRHFQQLSDIVRRENSSEQTKLRGASCKGPQRPFTSGCLPLKQGKPEPSPGGPLTHPEMMGSLKELRARVGRLQQQREAELARVRADCEGKVAALSEELTAKEQEMDHAGREFQAIKACMDEKLREREAHVQWLQQLYQTALTELQERFPLGLPPLPTHCRRTVMKEDHMEMQLLKRRSEKLLEETSAGKDHCTANHSRYAGQPDKQHVDRSNQQKKRQLQKLQSSLSNNKRTHALSHTLNKLPDDGHLTSKPGENSSQSLPSFRACVPRTVCIKFRYGDAKTSPATPECPKKDYSPLPPIHSSYDNLPITAEKLPNDTWKERPELRKPCTLACCSLPVIKHNKSSIPRLGPLPSHQPDACSLLVARIDTKKNNVKSEADINNNKYPRSLNTNIGCHANQESPAGKRSSKKASKNKCHEAEGFFLPPLT